MTKKVVFTLLAAGCSALIVSSCSWLEDWPPSTKSQIDAPYPDEVGVMKAPGGTWLSPVADPGGAESSLPGTPVTVADKTKNMSPAVATGSPQLLARLNELEQEVAILRNDMSLMAPALTRLTAMQKDISQILATMQPAAGTEGPAINQAAANVASLYGTASENTANNVAATPQAAPQPLTSPVKTAAVMPRAAEPVAQTPPQAKQSAQNSVVSTAAVKAIRFGEHPDKTRVVLDISGDLDFSYDMNNANGLLVVNLPQTVWNAVSARAIGGSSVVSGFRAVPAGDGVQLALQLNQDSNVIWAQKLPAADGKNPRIVLDLVK